MQKVVRHAKKATKILTEFDLKGGEKLRIYVYFWGNKEYARNLGYYGNTIYRPVLINRDGFERPIYKSEKGLPSLDELKKFYEYWNESLLSGSDRKRLKEVAKTLYELAEINTYFDSRQAHVVYQLLRITRGGPTFRIKKPSDVEYLNVKLVPSIIVSYKGHKSLKPVTPYIFPTRFSKALKILRTYETDVEKIASELKQDLANLAGPKGVIINLDTLADHADEQVIEVFVRESRSNS